MKKRIKKGYTLIELIVSIAILSIVIAAGGSVFKAVKSVKEELQFKHDLYTLHAALSYGKSVCFNDKISGTLLLNNSDNGSQIIFYKRSNKNNTESPRVFEISEATEILTNQKEIFLNEQGKIVTATTITLKKARGDKRTQDITIGVATDGINIKTDNIK